MNNKMSLSFGISLVVVGILNFWFETTNIILFGLSISALLFSLIEIAFSLIEIFSSKRIRDGWLEILYILPFALLISSFCYSNSLMQIPFMSELVNGRVTSLLTITSFGLLFVGGFINYKREEKMNILAQAELIRENFEYGILVMTMVTDYIKNAANKTQFSKDDVIGLANKIKNLCKEKGYLSSAEYELLKTGKYKFAIKEFDAAYKKVNEDININVQIDNHNKNKTNKTKED